MKSSRFAVTLSALALGAASAVATPLGTDITIFDKHSTAKAWETGSTTSPNEDNETEPGTIHTQAWDLERMFISGNLLTLVGGYNFANGVVVPGHNGGNPYTSGDIFVDTNNNAQFGSGVVGSPGLGGTTSNLYGYDFVFDLDFGPTIGTGTFNLRNLNTGTNLLARPTDIATSGPWKFASGNATVVDTGNFSYGTLTAGQVSTLGLLGGGSHYYLTIDASYFSETTDTFHYTMQCGNDNLMGRGTVPDSGSTFLLIGGALAGLAAFRRRIR